MNKKILIITLLDFRWMEKVMFQVEPLKMIESGFRLPYKKHVLIFI